MNSRINRKEIVRKTCLTMGELKVKGRVGFQCGCGMRIMVGIKGTLTALTVRVTF
jgi:hypothetical protein